MKDIQIEVNDICLSIPKYYLYPKLRYFEHVINDEQSSLEKYNNNIKKGIDYILSDIPKIIKRKTNDLRNKLISKYINNPKIKKIISEKFPTSNA